MSNEIQVQIDALEETGEAIEQVIQECGIAAIQGKSVFMQSVMMARGMTQMRQLLTAELMEQVFMPLQGTALGFLHDRTTAKEGPKEYPLATVRDCIIEGMLRGFRPVANEINIISGRFYGTKAGFERIIREFPGMSRLEIEPGVPHLIGDQGALVPFSARWVLNGEPMEMHCHYERDGEKVTDTRIPVRVNRLMGSDAIIGKAERKLYARIYKRITGWSHDTIDGDATEIVTEGVTVGNGNGNGGKKVESDIDDIVARRKAAKEREAAEASWAAPEAQTEPKKGAKKAPKDEPPMREPSEDEE